MLDVIEALVPTAPLVYEIDDAGEIHKLARPAEWLVGQFAAGEIALVCNGDEHQLVSLSASDMLQDSPVIQLSLSLHGVRYFDAGFELVRRFGAIVDAFHGSAEIVNTGWRMVTEYRGDLTDWLPPDATMVPAPLPPVMSWVMYWSSTTCEMLEFFPGDPRASLFYRCVPCDRGAVMVQLTEDVVDLDIPAHRAAVNAVYDAFPHIPQCAYKNP